MKLYEIAKEYQAFLDAVEAGEIPEEAIGDTLDGIVGEFDQKADNIACAIKGYMAEADALKKEEGALRDRRDSKMRKADQMKHYLSEQMQKMGKKEAGNREKSSFISKINSAGHRRRRGL